LWSSVEPDRFVRRIPPLPLLVRLTSVAVAAPLLARLNLPNLQRFLEPRRRVTPPDGADIDRVTSEVGRWVDALMRRGRPVIRPGCLTRGITLYHALRHRGIDVHLCFGIGRDDEAMAGHCWLDLDGRPLLEPVDPRPRFTEVVHLSREGVAR